jgi:hypothetical protein
MSGLNILIINHSQETSAVVKTYLLEYAGLKRELVRFWVSNDSQIFFLA